MIFRATIGRFLFWFIKTDVNKLVDRALLVERDCAQAAKFDLVSLPYPNREVK
jgi:hypothetical protein